MDERQQWRNVRGLSEDEVKVAIAELGNPRRCFTQVIELREMLFYRWGELDPLAANLAAKTMFPEGFSGSRQAVIAAWIKQGGAVAAWDAVREEQGMWACTQSVPVEVADMLVASLADTNDATAFREVLRLNDENCVIADGLCRARAGKASATAETRTAFLTAASKHPEPYVLDCAYQSLFREWAKTDFEAACAGAISMKIPEENVDVVRREIDDASRARQEAAEKAAASQ